MSQAGHSTGNGDEVVGPGPLHCEVVGGVVVICFDVPGGGVVVTCFDVLGGGVVVICFDVLGGAEVVGGGAPGFGTFDPGGGTLPVPP